MSSLVLVFLFLSIVSLSSSEASPFRNEKKEEVKRERPLHDTIMERMKKIRESLSMKGQDEEYKRYWEELIANNPDLAKRFHEQKAADLAAGLGDRLSHRDGGIRSQMDELQRRNIEELRELHRKKMAGESHEPIEIRRQRDRGRHLSDKEMEEKIREHQRIQEQLDHARREDFKNFEMKLEHRRRQKLKEMDETQRLREEARLKKLHDEKKVHEPLLHPASKDQFEDVWKTDDGFKDERFDIRTFFHLHDTNGDGTLDIREVEALFVNEIRKYYGKDFENDREAHEDMSRMREHVMSEVDRDHDSLITLEEFVRYANTDLFNIKEEWKPVGEDEQHKEFTDDEFKQYENEMEEDDYDYDDEGNLVYKPKTENHDGVPPEHHELPPEHHELPTEHHEVPTEHHEVPPEHHEVPPEHHEVPVAHDTKPDTGLPDDHGLPKGEKGLPEHVSPQDLPHDVPVGGANHNENPQAPIVETKQDDSVHIKDGTAPPPPHAASDDEKKL